MDGPFDYITPLVNGRSLVPDYAQEQLRQRLGMAQIAQANAQTQQLGVETQEKQQALSRAAEFQAALRGHMSRSIGASSPVGSMNTGGPGIIGGYGGGTFDADGNVVTTSSQDGLGNELSDDQTQPNRRFDDATSISNLMIQFPEFADKLKEGFNLRDKAAKEADLRQMGSVYGYLQAGRPADAAKMLRRRIDADNAAGQDTSDDEELATALESGDIAQIKQAQTVVGMHLAAATGPEHFATTYGALNKDGKPELRNVEAGGSIVSVDPVTGKATKVYESPYVKGPDGQVYQRAGGGDQSSPDGAPAPSGGRRVMGWTPRARDGGDNSDAVVDGKLAALSRATGLGIDTPLTRDQFNNVIMAIPPTEGGPGSLTQTNNNPGGIKNGKWAKSQPGYAGDVKGYAKFATPAAGQAAMLKLGGQFWNRGQRTMRDLIEGKKSAGGVGAPPAASNGLIPLFPDKPKPQRMTPEEVAAEGLNPDIVYYRGADGVPNAVDGQTKPDTGPLKPVPQVPTQAILGNRSTIREIDRAIALVKSRPNSIGLGTGALGDWFTQRNDPDGTPIRASVGKIGGKIIHDVSGAAVTMSEAPRFQPYVPTITDTAETALQKLQQMKTLAEADTADLESAWGPDNGYRGLKIGGTKPAPASSAPKGWGKAVKVK